MSLSAMDYSIHIIGVWTRDRLPIITMEKIRDPRKMANFDLRRWHRTPDLDDMASRKHLPVERCMPFQFDLVDAPLRTRGGGNELDSHCYIHDLCYTDHHSTFKDGRREPGSAPSSIGGCILSDFFRSDPSRYHLHR